MQVYRNILVAIDCSPVDDAIIEHVSALALQNSAKVYLLHVVHSHTLDQNRVLTEKARVTMAGYQETLEAQGVEAFILIRSGEPDPEILEEVESGNYDLVAMATHGHTFLGDLLFGSVSRTLKHKIQIPLLLLKPDRRGPSHRRRS
jgi:nucleotide-binding universal stress UspA family protein